MANPQVENGYTKISNEILEALAKIRINGEARQILDVIIRKTYGFNKKQDKISLSQFVLATSLTKQSVCRALKRLINMKIIIKIDNENIQIYQFNKDFDTWKSLSKLLKGVAVSPTTINEIDKEGVAVLRHTKDNITKENITKENLQAEACGKQVNEIINLFKKINPTITFNHKTNRSAAEDIINQFGYDKTVEYVKSAIAVFGKAYAPVITNPYHLKTKLSNLIAFYQSYQEKQDKGGKTYDFTNI